MSLFRRLYATLRFQARQLKIPGYPVLLVCVPLSAGCGRNSPPSPSPPISQLKLVAARSETAPAGTTGPWFEDPLGELQKNGVELKQLPLPTFSPPPVFSATTPPKAGEPPQGETSPKTPENGKPKISPPTSEFAVDVELVESAIKQATLNLRQNLQNATVYGTQYKEVQAYSEELALWIVLAARETSPPSWSRHGPALRDLAIEISQVARDLSPEAYQKAAKAFDSIDQLLQGNIPVGIPEGASLELPYSEFAHRMPLMRRLEIARKQLHSLAAKESDFKKNSDALLVEAAASGYLMQVMSEPGFSSADEIEYQQHAHRLIDASLAAVSATRERKLPEFQSALSAIEKACNDCHQDYRFNSE